MGSVWVGLDKRLRSPVAIKLMQPIWAENDEARTRFEREAMAVAQLRSPHIVQIFDYGIDNEVPFIVMEMLEGEDLHSRLRRLKQLSIEQASMVIAQAAKGLSAAHAAGIVHRDLKPANLFLVKSGDEELLKLLDFGVAKANSGDDEDEEVTKVGMVLGTPQYMSPEQARGMPDIDHRADLWSLGVITYRCLTGRLPFTGNNVTKVIVAMLTETAPPATQYAPHLPVEVDEFFTRALAPNPDDRFASANEMAKALASISPVSFPSLTMAEPSAELTAAIAHHSPPGHPSTPGTADSFGGQLTPPSAPSGAGLFGGAMDSFPSGSEGVATPPPEGLEPLQPGTGDAWGEGLAPTASQPLPVIPPPAAPAGRRSRLGLKLAALAFVALTLGAGLVFVTRDGDKPPLANAATPLPETIEVPATSEAPAATATEASASASEEPETAEPATSASAEPEAVAEAEPSAAPATKKPIAKGGGGRPKPKTGVKKPPPAKTATAKPPKGEVDPFSERL